MADEITGYAIAIDGLVKSIKDAENKFDGLARKSEETRTKIVAHFKEMGDNGVDYFIKNFPCFCLVCPFCTIFLQPPKAG